jgi:hypothetical protein
MVVAPIWAMDNLILASQSPRSYQSKVRFLYCRDRASAYFNPRSYPRSTLPSRPKSIGDQPGDLGRIGEAIGFSGVLEGAIEQQTLTYYYETIKIPRTFQRAQF